MLATVEEFTTAWGKFGLTDAEQVVIYDEFDSGEGDHQKKFYLVGSLQTIQPFSNHAMLRLMKELLGPVEGMTSEIIEDYKFLFAFFCRADIDSVLERRLWTSMTTYLCSKRVLGNNSQDR